MGQGWLQMDSVVNSGLHLHGGGEGVQRSGPSSDEKPSQVEQTHNTANEKQKKCRVSNLTSRVRRHRSPWAP